MITIQARSCSDHESNAAYDGPAIRELCTAYSTPTVTPMPNSRIRP